MNLNPPPTLSPLIENVLHEEEKERSWNMQEVLLAIKNMYNLQGARSRAKPLIHLQYTVGQLVWLVSIS